MKMNENVALAKAILNKKGIIKDSDEFKDYLKIREICGNSNGYVGILTRLRFEDNITDMDEIESIYDILKNSKIDISKLNKMSYDDILNVFYDELKTNDSKKDFELVFKDENYSYYKVHTYEGIMKLGSPAWCLKTKSNWDKYQNSLPNQWVVVHNKYKNRLVVPEDNILTNYNSQKGWVRYGISLSSNNEKYLAFNDNNEEVKQIFGKYTTFSYIMCTLSNIIGYYNNGNSVFEPCYKSFRGLKLDSSGVGKVVDIENLLEFFDYNNSATEHKIDKWFWKEVYIRINKEYGVSPILLVLNESYPSIIGALNNVKNKIVTNGYWTLNFDGSFGKLFEEYLTKSDSKISYGFKLEKGLISLEDIKKDKSFLSHFDNWILFELKANILVLNTKNNGKYHLLAQIFGKEDTITSQDYKPFFFYLDKNTLKINSLYGKGLEPFCEAHQKVIEHIKQNNLLKIETDVKKEEPIEEDPKSKNKLSRFLDFIKGKK